MKNTLSRLLSAVKYSVKPSFKSAVWLLKMMLPIMLLVSLLDYFGIVGFVSVYTEPLFNLLGLDGNAAFVFITSCMTSIYSAIGVMALFGFDLRSVTIMASMCLIAHNLIIEGAIQKKAGVSFFGITMLRISMSLLCGFLLNRVIPADYTGRLFLSVVVDKPQNILDVFSIWAVTALKLSVKVIIIVYLLNALQNILKEFKVISLITKPLLPLMAILGLPRSTTFLWIVANTLGLAYGGAIIVEEVERGELSRSDVGLLNTSIAQTHSLLEDTFLFVSLGVGLWWVLVPRFIFSIVTVWVQRGFRVLMLSRKENLLSCMIKHKL